MRTFFATPRFEHRPLRPSAPPLGAPTPSQRLPRFGRVRATAASCRSQSGVSIIEVLISSLIVAVVAIGTFTAFDTAGRASADQRSHAQASQLAAQDQERMRSLTAAELAEFSAPARLEAENGLCVEEESPGTNKFKYYAAKNTKNLPFCEAETAFAGQTYTGNVFEVTSTAGFVSAAQNSLACETPGGAANYIKTTSSVRWKTLGAARPAVTQSSIVTDNVTGLLVKVLNQNHEPLAGATVLVTGTSPAYSSAHTTPPAGCVIVAGITDTEVKVKVEKLTDVDRAGKNPPAEQTVEISPTTSATAEFIIAEPGAIEAEFVSEQSGSVTSAGVESDTFFARQGSITPPPENFVQGTAGLLVKAGTTSILKGVFPFARAAAPHTPEAYTVYAGDCELNNPNKVNSAIALTANNEALVAPGGVAKVKLEVPIVNVTLYKNTEAEVTGGKKETITSAETAEIVNSECPAVPTAQNQTTLSNKHKVTVNSSGGITPKYQPYAKALQLCVVYEVSSAHWTKFLKTFENKAKAGTTVVGYMKTASKPPEYELSTTKGALKCP
jgi:Tfp pilus assembly protein PilV